jgi:hypothetical protein
MPPDAAKSAAELRANVLQDSTRSLPGRLLHGNGPRLSCHNIFCALYTQEQSPLPRPETASTARTAASPPTTSARCWWPVVETSPRAGKTHVPTNTAVAVSVTGGSTGVGFTAPMSVGRRQHNLTILADGSVLATGGISPCNHCERRPR